MDKKPLERLKQGIRLRSRTNQVNRDSVAPTRDRKDSKHSKRTWIVHKRKVETTDKTLEEGFMRSWHQAMTGDTRPLSDLWDELDAE